LLRLSANSLAIICFLWSSVSACDGDTEGMASDAAQPGRLAQHCIWPVLLCCCPCTALMQQRRITEKRGFAYVVEPFFLQFLVALFGFRVQQSASTVPAVLL
jgi:hypothetical protein